MSQLCGFDSLTPTSPVQSDCYQPCLSLGCEVGLLGNGVCEAVCNFEVCGWDWGDCGYCASGCSETQLGDRICDSACNVEECGWDLGDCGSCSSGCYVGMIRNGVCEEACLVENCLYDGGDCWNMQCSEGCYPAMIGNSRLDWECLNEVCRWDGGDADCSPGCTAELQGNTQCESSCNTPTCAFDNYQCVRDSQGRCSDTCLLSKVGDGHCDTECYSAQCSYDEGDCGCAPDCLSADYGSCKVACLVPACDYDFMPDSPTCPDPLLRQASQVAHILSGSFATTYQYSDTCVTTQCSVSLWQSSLSTCTPVCNLPACLSSFGHCGSACAQGCERCVSPQRCVQCAPGLMLYFTICVSECPATFVPSAALCYYDGASSPATYYVTAAGSGPSLGTSNNPFLSLGEALAAVHTNSTHIKVLRGLHSLSVTVPSPFLQQWDDIIASYPAYDITIEGVLCTEESHPLCSSVLPVLVLNNLNPFQFRVHGKVVMRNLALSGGSPLLTNCAGDFCTFCPKGTYVGSGLVEEWGRTLDVGTFAPQSLCDQYQARTFIIVTQSSSLTLTNVTFTDFLQEFGSLISLSSGTVNLTSVVFTNITTATAVLLQTSDQTNCFEVGLLLLNNVSVRYLNSPFKYESALTLGGFMTVAGIQSVAIYNCAMSSNLLSTGKPLVSIGNFLQLGVSSCVFTDNVGVLLAISHNVTLPPFPTQTALNSFLMMNVNISDTEISKNTGNSLILLSIYSSIPDLYFARNQLSANLALNQAVLSLNVAGSWSNYERDGLYQQVTVGNATISVFFPLRRVILESMSVTNSSGPAMISLSNSANCEIRNLSISNCGNQSGTSLQFTANVCTGNLVLNDVFRTQIKGAAFVSNRCAEGPAAILGINLAGNVSITGSKFTGNEGVYGLKGSIVDISSLTTVYISNASLLSNTHTVPQGKGLLYWAPLSPSAVLVVTSCTFAFNSAAEGGTMNIIGNVLISNTAFTSNTCAGVVPAGLTYAPSPFGAYLWLSHISFTRNIGQSGAALLLSDPSASGILIQLSITDSSFESNASTESGGCVLIDSSVGLTQTSLISGTLFQGNSANNACIWIAYFIGTLTIDNSIFRLNSATSTSVLYGQHPRSVTSTPCLISLNNTLVERNSGFSIMFFTNWERYVEGRSSNLTSRSNIGRGIYLMFTYWQDQNSLFLNNSSPSSGACLVCAFYCVASTTNSVFQDSSGKLTGATMSINVLANILIMNCAFVNNFAPRGGAIFSEQGSTLNISNSRFHRNRSTLEGAAIILNTGPLIVKNSSISFCTFTENVSTNAQAAIVLISSQVVVNSCYFNGNSAPQAPGISAFLSIVTILESTFINQTSQQGVFISASAASSVLVSNCSFANGTATAKGGALYISSSVMWVDNSSFVDLTASNGAAIAAYSESTVVLSNSVLRRQNATSLYGGVIYSNESPLQDLGNRYEDCWNGIIVGELVHIYSEGSVYSSNSHLDAYSMSGAGVFCRDCPLIEVRSATFTGLTAVNGACIHLPSTSVFGLLDISNTTIQHSHGDSSGALLLENVDLTANQCVFANNSAGNAEILGNGGAISLLCPNKAAGCTALIAHSTFQSNTVSHEGGAIYWTDWKPTLSNVTFQANRAAYGPDIASFAITIANSGLSALTNVASGQGVADNLTVCLLDHYGQLVATDSSSLADLLSGNSSDVTITGNTRVQAMQGVFLFQGFTITAKPNSTTSIDIYTSGVDMTKAKTATSEDHYQSYLPVPVTLRPCVAGESLVEQTCYLCPEGKYSLFPENSCASCPEGAICYGNCTMAPQPGYWRESNLTDYFLACPNPNACLGSGSILYPTGVCAEGYFGNLCNGCLTQYFQTSRNYCKPCPGQVLNVLQTTGIALAFVIGVCGIIKFSLISAQKQNSNLSIFLKIFVNYLQLVAATSSFDMDWPSYALALFNVHENVADVGTRSFSFDCLLDRGGEDNQAQAIYTKIVLVTVMPLGIVGTALLFWGPLALICRKKTYIKQHVINSIVVTFFVAHPSIISTTFNIFNCRELDPGQFWLNSALNIRCWDYLHTRYSLIVALPCFIVWGIFAPMLVLLVLATHQKSLESQQMRIRLGFLYTGYELKRYYWEFVILYRKMLVIAMAVFLTSVSSKVQALSVLLVLVVALVLHTRNLPYRIATLNRLEKRGILVSAVTLYCGLFYVSNALEAYTKIFLFTAIVLANAYFLGMWLYSFSLAGCSILVMKIPFMKRIISAYRDSNNQVLPIAENPADVSFSIDRSIKVVDTPHNSLEGQWIVLPQSYPTVPA